jgi:predicted transcriptional regulator
VNIGKVEFLILKRILLFSADQLLSGENFQQLDEQPAVAEVGEEVVDAAADPREVRVDPLGERLLLHVLAIN